MYLDEQEQRKAKRESFYISAALNYQIGYQVKQVHHHEYSKQIIKYG